jgi:hypothetical protein
MTPIPLPILIPSGDDDGVDPSATSIAITILVIILILGSLVWLLEYRPCQILGDLHGVETKVIFGKGCYVNHEGAWIQDWRYELRTQ